MTNLEVGVAFAIGMLIIFGALIVARILDGSIDKGYFKTQEGIGALSSALLGISAITIIGLFIFGAAMVDASDDEVLWLVDGGVFAGLETTIDRDKSVFCQDSGADPTTHSDLGIWLNIFQMYGGDLSLDSIFSHNSCALSKDAPSNDSIGLRLEWRIFGK